MTNFTATLSNLREIIFPATSLQSAKIKANMLASKAGLKVKFVKQEISMKAYLIIYTEDYNVYQCIIGANDEQQAIDNAENLGLKNIVHCQYINAYILK